MFGRVSKLGRLYSVFRQCYLLATYHQITQRIKIQFYFQLYQINFLKKRSLAAHKQAIYSCVLGLVNNCMAEIAVFMPISGAFI
jgi:hypothetical protein